jgi:hypothetical protein
MGLRIVWHYRTNGQGPLSVRLPDFTNHRRHMTCAHVGFLGWPKKQPIKSEVKMRRDRCRVSFFAFSDKPLRATAICYRLHVALRTDSDIQKPPLIILMYPFVHVGLDAWFFLGALLCKNPNQTAYTWALVRGHTSKKSINCL